VSRALGWFRPWPAILIKATRDFGADHIPNVAASVTFYALLAIFPALSATISLYGLFGDAGALRQAVLSLGGLLPEGAISVIGDDLQRLSLAPQGSLGLAFAVSLVISLYSANAGMKALLNGLTVAYEQPEARGFFRLYLVSSAFTLASIVLAAVAVGLAIEAPAMLAAVGLRTGGVLSVLRWPILLLALMGVLSLLYRYGPDRAEEGHRTTPGSLFAAVAWMVMSVAFSWYAAHFGHFNKTFGSLGAVAGFMTWSWLSVMVVLFGAELNGAAGATGLRSR
jgi:membrane protein